MAFTRITHISLDTRAKDEHSGAVLPENTSPQPHDLLPANDERRTDDVVPSMDVQYLQSTVVFLQFKKRNKIDVGRELSPDMVGPNR